MIEGWAIDEHPSDAKVIRNALGSLIGSAGGLVAAGGLALTQKATPNMSVQIAGGTPAEGACFIPGYTTGTGPYFFHNTATYEQVIEAAGASNPRVDTIVARMYDTAVDASGKHEPVFQALRGEETSGATLANKKGAAAVPKNCLILGYCLVPSKAASIVTADIENVAALLGLVAGGVNTAALANEAVTDAKVVKGRALVETENAYGAMTERAASTNFTPSATRTTVVVLSIYLKASEPARAKITVGGVEIAVLGDDTTLPAGTPSIPFTFIVPPAVTWSWTNENVSKVMSSYLTL